jgi:hypothetical protein
MHDSKQVPSIIEQVSHVTNDVAIAAIICREQIARPHVMSKPIESAAHHAGGFAADEDPHASSPRVETNVERFSTIHLHCFKGSWPQQRRLEVNSCSLNKHGFMLFTSQTLKW